MHELIQRYVPQHPGLVRSEHDVSDTEVLQDMFPYDSDTSSYHNRNANYQVAVQYDTLLLTPEPITFYGNVVD